MIEPRPGIYAALMLASAALAGAVFAAVTAIWNRLDHRRWHP